MKLGAIFYQLGAPVWRAPSKLATMLLLPYIKVNIHSQRGGAIFHVLILHVSVRKKLGSKHADIDDDNPQETRMKNVNAFD